MSEFEKLVKRMRDTQKKYFKTRETYWLRESKHLEREVDLHLLKINEPELKL